MAGAIINWTKEDMGYWELPKPLKGQERDWHTIARVTLTTIPFGYEVNSSNKRLLEPIPEELDALELAKQHIKQYSYRDVAQWLSRQTGRSISHMGLKKRINIERRRKKAVIIKKRLAQRLKKTLQEIEKLENGRVGAYANGKSCIK